jgi:hypothetical protein
MAENQNKRVVVLLIILAISVAGALAYTFSMRVAEAPVTEETPPVCKQVQAPQDSAAQAPVKERVVRTYEPAAQAPLTLKALQYVPEQAQVAIGIPAAASLVERVVPFVQRFLPQLDLNSEIELIASDLAKDMEVPAEGGLVGVLAAMGIDSQAGMAAFLDLTELSEVFAEAAASGKTDKLPDMSAAKGLLVIPVNDPAKAEASLMKLAGDLLSGMEAKEESVNDITVKFYGDIGGYFVNDAVLALGNDMALLAGAAARAKSPAQFQYGSTYCPADDIHEAVALIFGDRVMPLLDIFAEQISSLAPTMQVMINAQFEKLHQVYADVTESDPMLITCRLDEQSVELKTKIDTDIYPGLIEYMGQAKPLRWAQLLPENTMAFLSLNFTEEAKKQITDVYLKSIPEEVSNRPGVSQGLMYGNSALQLLGGEITLGLTGFEPADFPTLFLMIQIANTAGAQILLQMAPQVDQEAYRDVPVKMLGLPFPIPVYFAMVTDALVISNSDAGIRSIIDLVKDGKTSGLFEKLNPPIPPETPIYQALVIKPSLYTDVIAPLVPLMETEVPAEMNAVLGTIAGQFEEIRMLNEMQGTWSVSRISVLRKTGS